MYLSPLRYTEDLGFGSRFGHQSYPFFRCGFIFRLVISTRWFEPLKLSLSVSHLLRPRGTVRTIPLLSEVLPVPVPCRHRHRKVIWGKEIHSMEEHCRRKSIIAPIISIFEDSKEIMDSLFFKWINVHFNSLSGVKERDIQILSLRFFT